jgi:hypothetical protein
MNRWIVGVAVAVMAIAGACGGGGDGDEAAVAGEAATTTVASATAGKGGPEVPAFIGEFDRVCTTQVGFPGVAAYEGGPGVHPVVLFEEFRGESFVESARSLPGGWKVEQDADFEDTSDLETAQLVACSDRTEERPTGVKCQFKGGEDDGGKPVELELVDAVYELKVYAATTGELQHQQTLEARNTECPFIATFKKGDTTYVNQPSDDDYIAALKPVVAP